MPRPALKSHVYTPSLHGVGSIYNSLCLKLYEISSSVQKICFPPHLPLIGLGWRGQCLEKVFLGYKLSEMSRSRQKWLYSPTLNLGVEFIYKNIILLGIEQHIKLHTERSCLPTPHNPCGWRRSFTKIMFLLKI